MTKKNSRSHLFEAGERLDEIAKNNSFGIHSKDELARVGAWIMVFIIRVAERMIGSKYANKKQR